MTSQYQRNYLQKTHRFALWILLAHIPIAVGVAWFYHNGVTLAAGLGVAIFAGPWLCYLLNPSGRSTSLAFGIASQCFSALLIHAARGATEFHFHVFVVLVCLVVFGDWRVVVGAAVTIAVQHTAFFFLLPASVFNYQATFAVVLLHAVFVVLATIPASLIADRFGRFVRAQGVLSERLNTIADQVVIQVAQLNEGSREVAESTSRQAGSIEETSSALEQISSLTRRNTQNAQSVREFTTLTRLTAEAGAASTKEMGRAMQSIRTASAEMREAMNGIKTASSDVFKIIKTIDGIAFQTNILALNAAVEAARAGEAGMGFAVVSDEVRNLAKRSGQAARETTAMIEVSIQRGEAGVRVTEKVTASIEEVAAKSRQLEEKLAEILVHARKVDEQVAQIASACAEQSEGIAHVTTAVSQMDQVTQNTAATAQASVAAVEELNTQAVCLTQAVAELLMLAGENRQTGSQPNPAPASISKPDASRTAATAHSGNGNGRGPSGFPVATKRNF